MNSFGHNFRVSIFGESHGAMVGVTLDGVRSGMPLSADDFEADMSRRRSGAVGSTPRREEDLVEILSGVYNGCTTGAPLTLAIRNGNVRSADYSHLKLHPRPSHADYVAHHKFGGFNDPRGGGHFSGRLTAALTAAGVVAKRMLGDELSIKAQLVQVGGDKNAENFERIIRDAQAARDSVGGVVECRVGGLEVGVGEPFFDSVESVLSHVIFSIPAVRGVEFGTGFEATSLSGSSHNDAIISQDGATATNHAGGVVGGITNGNELVLRVAIKPTPSISTPQQTFRYEDESHLRGEVAELSVGGRHDSCIAVRAVVVVEAAVAIGLCSLK